MLTRKVFIEKFIYFTWMEKMFKMLLTEYKFFWLNEILFWYHEKKDI